MSSLPYLTLIPAGAGSGKTHRIKEQLADWVQNGLVQSDRIAASTFTEAAANELRERIRKTLMQRGHLEAALKLDQSFICTIHAFGKRLLSEYAFEAGICPQPRLLTEDEGKLLLRKAISRIDRIEAVSRRLRAFGYRFDFGTETTDVEAFRQRILEAINMLRTIGGSSDRDTILKHALDHVARTYGPVEDGVSLTSSLRHSVESLMDKYPACMRDFVNSDSAKKAVEGDFRNIQQAAKTDALDDNWALWKALQDLKVFKKNDQLPSDYQDLAREVMGHACALYRHPGPRDDALQHTEVLLSSAWDALTEYAVDKLEKGIIDYTDMIDGAHRLLSQPEVIKHLAGRFDCLLIDEFQDTNPLQFSFLWKLHQAGVPALVVGDLKQSIMGFQSADPRLMASLLEQHPDQCQPLDGNWRSQARLMDMVNAFGTQMFGKAYTLLRPRATYTSRLDPLEIIRYEGTKVTADVMSQHVAAHVRGLLADERIEVFDRHLNTHRRLRGEDIAVLAYTHTRLAKYATALRQLDIRVRLDQDGWFESREVQLAYHALSFVADPQDRHATLYLAVTELGQDSLTTASENLLRKEALSFPFRASLEAISGRQADLTVDELVIETMEAMQLLDFAAVWPESSRVRANLVKLMGEGRAFVSADREALAGAGFHGSGLKTFLAWLRHRVEERDGDRQPEPKVHDEDAVNLVTWHASKGREWPIVIVTHLDWNANSKLPSLDVQYTNFNDLGNVLDNARVEFSPDFDAPETVERFRSPLDEKAGREGLNVLYVALTRARERLILEWPANLEKSSRYTYWHLLKESARAEVQGNTLQVGKEAFPCRVVAASKETPPDFDEATSPGPLSLPRSGRRALQRGTGPSVLHPVFAVPSQMPGQEEQIGSFDMDTIEYGPYLEFDLPPGINRGLLMHRAIELLGQGVPEPVVRGVLPHEVSEEDWTKIQQMSSAFLQHIRDIYRPISLHWEVPIVSRNLDGVVISGTIDLIVEGEEGLWIIDHKSDQPRDLREAFLYYLPQLQSYARALSEGLGKPVSGIAIHWACLGAVTERKGSAKVSGSKKEKEDRAS